MAMLGLIRPLFHLRFWFDLRGTPFSPWVDQLLLAFMLCLLVAALAAWRVQRQAGLDKYTRRAWRKVFSLCLGGGLSGLILYLFTWQRVPIFSMRIFDLLWLVIMVIVGRGIVRYAFQEVPAIRTKQAERAAYQKWLPKSKR